MKMVIQALDESSLCQTNHFVDPFNGILITQIVIKCGLFFSRVHVFTSFPWI